MNLNLLACWQHRQPERREHEELGLYGLQHSHSTNAGGCHTAFNPTSDSALQRR
jgi:hypothetical protein